MTVLAVYAAGAAGVGAWLYREGAAPIMVLAGAVYWPALAAIALIMRLP